jgi:pyridoxal phosphate enzyme (YggS family)
MPTDLESPADLREQYERTTARIEEAAQRSGRTGQDVLMVAVTKYASPDQLRALLQLGHADLGENRAQQLTQRAALLSEFLNRKRTLGCEDDTVDKLPERVRWHMVGHLQRNKIKDVVPVVDLVHSVDTLRLAEELHNFASKTDRVTDVLIQVNASGESSKYGMAPAAVTHLAEQIDSMMHLRLRGLMTIAPYSENPEDSRGVFARTAELFDDLRREPFAGEACNILSMGMSNDYAVAIEEGANVVRLGRALFGEQEG